MHEEPEGSGHFVSVKNADLVRKQDEAKRKTSLVYAKESTINQVQRDKDNEDKSSVTAAGGEHSGKDELEEEAKAHLLALEKRNMATLAMRRGSNTNAVNMGGRGGAIRRPSATPVDDDNSDGEHATETKAEDLPQGHHVQIQMPRPNIMAGRGGRGHAVRKTSPEPSTSTARIPSPEALHAADHTDHTAHEEAAHDVPPDVPHDVPHEGHRVQVAMPKPNLMAGRGGRGGRGLGGRGTAPPPAPEA
jgi:hypothetical protein